ncbi:hypothetical protein NPIL_702411 [Nephila pilipes]|uniref:Reverse transcriptase RNase H-like domain-containing protein n=1 Tax=Nephila pilipes TaxID=299642 RepID=A0A8X6UIG0_NEPPI|nr:hypothetical protein NPIL_702411 [Nephila pilipes]
MAIKHFRHVAEDSHFTILMDHKSHIFSFRIKKTTGKCSPRKLLHLDFIIHFATNIEYLNGSDKVVAYIFSQINQSSINSPNVIDLKLMAEERNDEDLYKNF